MDDSLLKFFPGLASGSTISAAAPGVPPPQHVAQQVIPHGSHGGIVGGHAAAHLAPGYVAPPHHHHQPFPSAPEVPHPSAPVSYSAVGAPSGSSGHDAVTSPAAPQGGAAPNLFSPAAFLGGAPPPIAAHPVDPAVISATQKASPARTHSRHLGIALPTTEPAVYSYGRGQATTGVERQLEVTPITIYATECGYRPGRLVAVNSEFIGYGIKGGNIRLIHLVTSARELLKGHKEDQLVADIEMCPVVGVNRLASIGEDGRLFVWGIFMSNSGTEIITNLFLQDIPADSSYGLVRVTWSPADPNHLAVADSRFQVRLYNLASGATPTVCQTHSNRINDVRFSNTGQLIISASEDGSLLVWSTAAAAVIRRVDPFDGAGLQSAAFVGPSFIGASTAPWHSRLVVVGNTGNRTIKLVDIAHPQAEVHSLTIVGDGDNAETQNVLAIEPCGQFLTIADISRCYISVVHIRSPSICREERIEGAAFDFVSEFAIKYPVLSAIATRGGSLSGHPESQELEMYCVQSKRIQQYHLLPEDAVEASVLEFAHATAPAAPFSEGSPLSEDDVALGGDVPPPAPADEIIAAPSLESEVSTVDLSVASSSPSDFAPAPAADISSASSLSANAQSNANGGATSHQKPGESHEERTRRKETPNKSQKTAAATTAPAATHSTPISGDAASSDAFRALEDRIVQRVERIMLAQSEKQAAREKERAHKEKQDREKALAAMHQALSSQIQKEIQGLVVNLGQVVKTTVEQQMGKPQLQAYQTSVSTVLLPKIEKAVQDQTRQVAQQQRTETDRLVASSKESLAKSFRECFQETLIPAFEQSCQRMFSQIDSTFQRGMAERNEAAKRQEDAVLEQLRAGVTSLHDARGLLQQNVAAASSVPGHILPPQPPQHSSPAVPSSAAWNPAINAAAPVAAAAATGSIHGDPAAMVAGAAYPYPAGAPPPAQLQQPLPPQQSVQGALNQIFQAQGPRPVAPFPAAPGVGGHLPVPIPAAPQQHVQPLQPPMSVAVTPGALDQWNKAVLCVTERKFDDAFSTVLSMTNLDAVVALCRAVNPRDIFAPLQLSQVVLLSLMQQLGVDLRTDAELKIAYLKDGLQLLDKQHSLIGQHIPAILQQLRLNLRQVTDDPRNISQATVHEMRLLYAFTAQVVPS